MLDLKKIVNNFDEVSLALSKRSFDLEVLKKLHNLLGSRSKIMTETQELEAARNALSKRGGNKDDKSVIEKNISEAKLIKEKLEVIKAEEAKIQQEVQKLLLIIPNIPNKNVPVGKDENDNVIIAKHENIGRGKVTNVKPHYEVALELGIVDFERAVKTAGSRFWIYKGLGAKLVRALENFMLDVHIKKGYLEFTPPVIVNAKTMQGTGQLPKFADDLFKLENKDFYLIPTAEVPLTNYYADEIVDLSSPKLFTAYTPCFRSEAGSGGKDMRGLIRSHQFHKVELVKITSHDSLESEYKKTVDDAKNILELLELPFQELQLCSGDLGFSSEETIDLEVWIPSEKRFRETSSISRFGDFQGRRANIRYKNADGKNVSACTINGSGLAIDRTIAAILENYQNKDGSVDIPKVLIPYMGVDKITKGKSW